MLTWLQEEHQADRTVDICILQETAWREDMEFTTTPVGPGSLTWHAVHSAGGDRTGILCLVRAGLLNPTHIRTATLVPGRLVHLRLLFEVPLDILCIYQFAWNLQKVELRGAKNKTDAMLRQRRQIWQHVDKWIRAIPQRNGCVVLGDFNVSVLEEQHMCGAGLPPSTSAAHPDQGALLEILRAHRCTALNTWSRPGPANRTFLSPHAGEQQGTQIDSIVTRGHLVDHTAKQAAPFDAAFVPVSGCRHRPLNASLPVPRQPRSSGNTTRLHPRAVQTKLQNPQFRQYLRDTITLELGHAEPHQSSDDILLQGWQRATEHTTSGRGTEDSARPGGHDGALTQQVKAMWSLRGRLHRLGQHLARWTGRGPTASVLLQAWRLAAQLQNSTRCLRKACRLRKTEMVVEVVRSDNIWQAAKRFAPKAPRRRLQLRSPAGHLQSHEQELQQIADYFTSLYMLHHQLPSSHSSRRTSTIHPHEIRDAMGRLRPGKAMPSTSAPAALWKLVCNEVVPFLATQFRQYLVRGARTMPPAWSLCELVLLPKPGKSLKTPAHLRPICLLPLQAKVLAAVLASRLQPFVARYLEEIPQFAYVHQRSLGQALERVAGHCAEVRALLTTPSTSTTNGNSDHSFSYVEDASSPWTSPVPTTMYGDRTWRLRYMMPKSPVTSSKRSYSYMSKPD